MSKQPQTNILPVDLVVVIDTSPSMKDEANALSEAAEAAIQAASSSCPCDLKVAWFGIEGTWKGTIFSGTIRDYLTKQCKISESNLRGRRRGEVKGAGAQEDAARTIEDVSVHFNWRAGAARAIFYLGDEALEGGGDRTEQKDIEAANLAIEKARVAGVRVHTYFGTSKSKHRDGIQKEYARVATQTGGQAFTDREAISGFETVLEKVICSSRSGQCYRSLTVNSKTDCYMLDESRLSAMESERISIELNPGIYVVRINKGTFNYWSANQQLEGEPWVMLWIHGGIFINKKTNVEVGESWSSLNGYDDTLTLEVKQTTKLCGLFVDTYGEDNKGQVSLSILKDE